MITCASLCFVTVEGLHSGQLSVAIYDIISGLLDMLLHYPHHHQQHSPPGQNMAGKKAGEEDVPA